ncbi:MAG: NAD(P)-dependent oxidoreductase [Kiritimatiellia bacterium]
MKILVADKVSPRMIDDLQALGATVAYEPDVTAENLPASIGDTKVLVVRSKKVTAETIQAAKSLSLIVRAGAGVNTIDLEAASKLGVYVANCPGKNTDAVAELAIGLLIACDRGIADATQSLRSGQWEKGKYGKGAGLKGRTLGIIGTGSIGMAVIQRALAMDMQVIAYSRSLTLEKAEELGIGFCGNPVEVAKKADAISVHLAAAKETKGLLDTAFFAAMRKGAIFINTARGDILDQTALEEAIATKGIKVGLDVFANEPAGSKGEFPQMELAAKVTGTPHIGASTEQAEEAIAAEAVRVVHVFMGGTTPPNVVNLRTVRGAGPTLVVRHYNRVGVLAAVFDALRNEGINIEDLQNLIFAGGETASCSLAIDKAPSGKLLDQLTFMEHIIEITISGA